ncbi:5-bromo-4-chloroindolyl phosphate hydrolase [Ureibacillus massiliensis 4400831 = CIP 108448 = CCUG 49529]|uniref:5-bromo-4-chloroindolyl phosphate hydrolase n=1 Tax=Ureibacillus massiliensis 4400831 = CIP 108448 = CCUG 49529 TaxID=1211035 RepID=A0A0A3IZ88_9BACL|nr:5-bromo-4-chloroindolyl phosphate hydrolysis family protein [Ureibacillus massiliensis]KGR88740.1 5-bromo-4-chloroindolyl phosphate hydrolase [Ureibacillus massiliensis 4400831 = CIP 108448 = CCUG 49529]
MLGVMNFVTRHAFNFLISLTVFILLVVNFDLGIFLVPIITIISYFVSNSIIKFIQKSKKSKELGLSRSELKHIETQLKQAKSHIFSLTQQYIRVRSISSFKILNEMTKLSRRIVNIVQTSPQKFYSVQDFFYSHLPSAVELTSKYTLLTQQQLKDMEIHLALEDTRKTLKDLHETLENDLKLALESDLLNLKMELDYAKLENDKNRNQKTFRGDNL